MYTECSKLCSGQSHSTVGSRVEHTREFFGSEGSVGAGSPFFVAVSSIKISSSCGKGKNGSQGWPRMKIRPHDSYNQ